jgi:hypothetical protein
MRDIGRRLARDAVTAHGGDTGSARGGADAADAQPGGATFQRDPAAFDTGGGG